LNALLDRYSQADSVGRKAIIDQRMEQRRHLSPWNELKNVKMLAGYSPLLLSEDQLLITKDDYAFDRGDIDFLLHKGLNPYTAKPFDKNTLTDLKAVTTEWQYFLKPYPLDQVLEGMVTPNTWCPDKRTKLLSTKNRKPVPTDIVYHQSLQPDDPLAGRSMHLLITID
jgi:hypothetical protein